MKLIIRIQKTKKNGGEAVKPPPSFVLLDQMPLQLRHSHNFICSLEPK